MKTHAPSRSLLGILLVTAFLAHQSDAWGYFHDKCNFKCQQMCRFMRGPCYDSDQFEGCMEDCMENEEDEWDEKEETMRTRFPITGNSYRPIKTVRPTFVYPKWTPPQPHTIRPVRVTTPSPPYPSVTYRPPPVTFPPRSWTSTTRRRVVQPVGTSKGKPTQFGCGVRRNLGTRIIGGSPAQSCEFPWIVVVEINVFSCGGTIISPRHILGAAHCFKNVIPGTTGVVPPSEVKVRYGASQKSQMKTIGVTKIHVNPNYEYFKRNYDVAVLTLEADLQFGNCVGQICLPDPGQRPEGMNECVTAGWGTMDATLQTYNTPNTLQKVTLPLVSRDLCNRVWNESGRFVIDDTKLCAGYYGVGGKDACKGDSGGPLMCRNGMGPFTEFGIVSFGNKCAEPLWPGVYTNVANPKIMSYIIAAINDP